MGATQKVMVVGSGGREHALCQRLAESDSVGEVVATPGNAGTSATHGVRNRSGDPLEVAKSETPDLVVVGPEAPLCDGLVDQLTEVGITAYGPSAAAAQLEGSKAFMKAFAERHGIRSAGFRTVQNFEEAKKYIDAREYAPVVKADGLCAGKGVVVAATHEEALDAAREMLDEGRFGDAGRTVVLEDRIDGFEASVHAICDGTRALVLPVAQDHKRIGDGDTGPNTGGMGAYGPTPLVTSALRERIESEIVRPVVAGMAKDGIPYRGTLFAGLMIPSSGDPYLLEINVRFGDPETQVIMSLLEGDFARALGAAARGELGADSSVSLGVREEYAVCVVQASATYPASSRKGDVITGIAEAESMPGVRVYHAGTRLDGKTWLTDGGRVLGVTARGPTLEAAHARAYRAADAIRFDGKQQRTDIGFRALRASVG